MANRTDNFNRADSSSALGTPSDGGSDWSALQGTWGIYTNQARTDEALNEQHNVAVLESSIADEVDVEYTVTLSAASVYVGIVVRATNNDNYILAVFSTDTNIVIYKKEAGSFTDITSSSASSIIATGNTLRMRVSGNSFEVFINNVSKATASNAFNNTATKHGMHWYTGTLTSMDNFSITAVGGGSPGGGEGPHVKRLGGVCHAAAQLNRYQGGGQW